MKKFVVVLVFAMGLLCGCGNADGTGSSGMQDEGGLRIEQTGVQDENVPEDDMSKTREECMPGGWAVQGGPYGEISIPMLDLWNYEMCPMDSDDLLYGMYGIQFSPKGVSEGYVAVAYIDNFGVCGTGLAEEDTIIAGSPASIGTYDNHEYWDYIAFQGEYEGIVALTYFVDTWWDSRYSAQILGILDMMIFDQGVREGGAYIDDSESENDEIGLYVFLKNISATGATLIFNQYDAEAPEGELTYGDAFVLQQQKNGKWENVPTVIEDYGFNAIGYILPPGEIAEMEVDWEWLYGELPPGEYRIGKSVSDFVEPGKNEEYMVYAQFILN